MTNLPQVLLLSLLLIASTVHASGAVELIVRSARTIIIEPTVCANFECPAPDDLTPARKVTAGTPLRFKTGGYQGEARERFDIHLKLIDPQTQETIALEHHKPLADTDWQTEPIVILTDQGFNVTVELRNLCATDYHGKRCGRYCVAPHDRDRHWECSTDGERRCSAGWTGADCSIPMCSSGCSGRGRCVAPEQCQCTAGFNGTRCEQCFPRPGCVHGTCRNDTPMTCHCKPGFMGANCDIDLNTCSLTKPCRNGGQCSTDPSSTSGFRCSCPFGFIGARCETPLSSVRCSAEEDHVCQNGGTCFSLDRRSFQCQCPFGFSGKFCEIGEHRDCSTKKCSAGATCQMIASRPICVAKSTTTESPKFIVINNYHLHHSSGKDQEKKAAEVEELTSNALFLVCILFCIVGLFVAIRVGYVQFIAKRRASPLPMTTMPSTPVKAPPTYKVCIIDAEMGASSSGCSSSSSSECEPHFHSPPPAYSSPVLPQRLYKSIPTDDEPPFRDV
ncbi:unnamed protein product [Caenorhabditis sp. 36 PRJEB53466]|nr:unnamed protein product [Caenorhabditis sp. 36 PRJEB53466]